MAAKKNNSAPIYECYICGKVISGDHVKIITRRRSELHIHKDCVPKGERK